MRRRNRRRNTPIKGLAAHIAWFTFNRSNHLYKL
jgi:hypothetical protein